MFTRFASLIMMMAGSCAFGAATFAPEPPGGAPTVTAAYPADGATDASIGALTVQGVGKITLKATRTRNRLVIKAVDGGGASIGRAETSLGLGDTFIYVLSPLGLYKIILSWRT